MVCGYHLFKLVWIGGSVNITCLSQPIGWSVHVTCSSECGLGCLCMSLVEVSVDWVVCGYHLFKLVWIGGSVNIQGATKVLSDSPGLVE